VHTVQGLAEAAKFASRLSDPWDLLLSPPGKSAAAQLVNGGLGAANYLGSRLAKPELVTDDIRKGLHKANVSLNPLATPPAPTFAGELRRNFGIGMNEGELGFNLGTLALGGAGTKAASALGKLSEAAGLSKALTVEDYLKMGLTPAQAAHFDAPYVGMGAHFIPRDFRFPKAIKGIPLPKELAGKGLPTSFIDSPLNVLKLEKRGPMYIRHFETDGRYYGGAFPRRVGGTWSGRKLGLIRHEPFDKVWYGAPPALKALVGRTAVQGSFANGAQELRR
jgi:hypothetical protein